MTAPTGYEQVMLAISPRMRSSSQTHPRWKSGRRVMPLLIPFRISGIGVSCDLAAVVADIVLPAKLSHDFSLFVIKRPMFGECGYLLAVVCPTENNPIVKRDRL